MLGQGAQFRVLVRPREADVADASARNPGGVGRDLGLTSRWNSSSSVSLLAISGMIRVQNQWAPDGLAGSSVSRLIATRI